MQAALMMVCSFPTLSCRLFVMGCAPAMAHPHFAPEEQRALSRTCRFAVASFEGGVAELWRALVDWQISLTFKNC